MAEETLDISIYCTLIYQSDSSAGIIAWVSHKGDGDFICAVTVNKLRVLAGYDTFEAILYLTRGGGTDRRISAVYNERTQRFTN